MRGQISRISLRSIRATIVARHGGSGRQRGSSAAFPTQPHGDRRLRRGLACACGRGAARGCAACASCPASSPSRRSIATRPGSRRLPSRWWKAGDYVDIRFQDEVRYKKPVGIYWLQAGVVKAAAALGYPAGAHHHLALPRAFARRCRRRGSADLLGGAGAGVAAGRRARRGDDGELRAARHSSGSSPRPMPMLLATVVAAMGAMARAYLSANSGSARGGRGLDDRREYSGPRSPRACCSRGR